jgi:hypothetical protein
MAAQSGSRALCTSSVRTCDLAESNVLHTLDILALGLEAPELTDKVAVQICATGQQQQQQQWDNIVSYCMTRQLER